MQSWQILLIGVTSNLCGFLIFNAMRLRCGVMDIAQRNQAWWENPGFLKMLSVYPRSNSPSPHYWAWRNPAALHWRPREVEFTITWLLAPWSSPSLPRALASPWHVGAQGKLSPLLLCSLRQVLFKLLLGSAKFGEAALFLSILGVFNILFITCIPVILYFTKVEYWSSFDDIPWGNLCGFSVLLLSKWRLPCQNPQKAGTDSGIRKPMPWRRKASLLLSLSSSWFSRSLCRKKESLCNEDISSNSRTRVAVVVTMVMSALNSELVAKGNNITLLIGLVVLVVQSPSHVQLFATPWSAARQASLSFTISPSLFKLMSIEPVMPSNHLILCHPPLFSALHPSQNQGLFQWVGSPHPVAKVLASASVLPLNIGLVRNW